MMWKLRQIFSWGFCPKDYGGSTHERCTTRIWKDYAKWTWIDRVMIVSKFDLGPVYFFIRDSTIFQRNQSQIMSGLMILVCTLIYFNVTCISEVIKNPTVTKKHDIPSRNNTGLPTHGSYMGLWILILHIVRYSPTKFCGLGNKFNKVRSMSNAAAPWTA